MFFYTYRITNLHANRHYYGVRSCKIEPKEDLGFVYFSSSSDSDFINEQLQSPERFKYKVLKQFNSFKDAIAGDSKFSEYKLHRKFNVGVSPKFYNKVISSGSWKCGPGYVLVFDSKYEKYVKLATSEYHANKTRFSMRGIDKNKVLTKNKHGERSYVHVDVLKHNEELSHFRTGTTCVKKNGSWVIVNLTNIKGDDIYPTSNKIAVKNRNDDNLYITVDEFRKNKNKYKTHTAGKTQLVKHGEIINVTCESAKKYLTDGWEHINKGRTNCINVLTGEVYKEFSNVLSTTPWLRSYKRNNTFYYKYDDLYFSRSDLDEYLKKTKNISFYKYNTHNEINKVLLETIMCKVSKGDFYITNKTF